MDKKLLKEARKKRGITQKEMAEALGYSGKSGYSCLETGKIKVSVDKSLEIKKILDLSETEYQNIFFASEVQETRT